MDSRLMVQVIITILAFQDMVNLINNNSLSRVTVNTKECNNNNSLLLILLDQVKS